MLEHLRQLFKNHHTRPMVIKTLVFLGLFGVTFYGAYGMAKSFAVVHKQKVSKNKELKGINDRLNTINSESSLNNEFQREKILREKLHMVKPGEDLIIIVPENKTEESE